MAFVIPRVRQEVLLNSLVGVLAVTQEGKKLRKDIETIIDSATKHRNDIAKSRRELDVIQEQVTELKVKLEDLLISLNKPPRDDYALCGDPYCDGDCRTCQEGEYHGEEWVATKYHYKRR